MDDDIVDLIADMTPLEITVFVLYLRYMKIRRFLTRRLTAFAVSVLLLLLAYAILNA
jgi:hypothetical protein